MLQLILIAAAAAQAGPARPEAAGAAAPRPLGSAAAWVSMADYPAEALAGRREGLVGFQLDVDAAGNVVGCRIMQGSGAPSLDATTCGLLFQRARFEPARDAAGAAVAGRYTSRVRWAYPAEIRDAGFTPALSPEPVRPIELRTAIREAEGSSVLKVNEDGMITSCERAPNPYKNVLPPPDICGLFPVGARYSAPALFKGRPMKRKITVDLSVYDVNVR